MAAVAAAVIGAVGAIGGGYLSSKGNKGSSDSFTAPLNPGFNTLLDLFGANLKTRGRVKGVFDDPNTTGLFEEDAFKNSIRDLLYNSPGLYSGEQQATQGYLDSNQPGMDLQRAQDAMAGLLGSGKELSETGFRQDAGPAYDEAIRRYKADVLPELAEVAGQQVGIQSSSFLDSANRSAADLLGEAALQQVNLDESAAARRANGLGMYNQLILSQLGLPSSFGNDLLALGTGTRNVINTQQSRPFNVFSALTGLGNDQPFGVSGFNPNGSGTTQLLEGLASGVTQPGVADALGSLFKKQPAVDPYSLPGPANGVDPYSLPGPIGNPGAGGIGGAGGAGGGGFMGALNGLLGFGGK